MSESSAAATVTSAFDALSSGGVEAMIEYVHPEGVTTTPAELAAEPDTYRGHDGLRRWFDSFYEVMDRIDVTVIDVVEVDPTTAVAALRLDVRGRATGIELRQLTHGLFRTRDGKLWQLEYFESHEEALAAARGA
jgi:ketosteroid isomerase-like protein